MLNPAVSLSNRSAGAQQPPAPSSGQPPGAPPFAQFLNEGIHANGPDKAATQAGDKPTTPEDEAAASAESQGPSETVTAQVRAARALAQRQRTAQAGQPGLDRSADAKAKVPDAPPAAEADADASTTKAADGDAESASADARKASDAAADPSLAAQVSLPAAKAAKPEAQAADAGDKALRNLPLAAAVQQALAPAASTADTNEAAGADPRATSRKPLGADAAATDATSTTPEPKARGTTARSPGVLAANRAAAQGSAAATASDTRASTATATQASSRDAQGPTFEQLLAMPARGNPAEAGSGPFRADASSVPAAGFAAAVADARPASATAETGPALQAPVHSAAFAPELAERVTLLAVDGVQTAQLELNPAEMGPVQIDIVVDAGRAEITFQAAQADTRQALERALPDLAGALREQGLTLAGGGVFQQSQQGSSSDSPDDEGRRSGNAGVRGTSSRSAPDAIDVATAALSRRGVAPPRGLLDTFA
jgi:flagellar hook-length control protein FliK